MRWEN
jgi:hypothetical protein